MHQQAQPHYTYDRYNIDRVSAPSVPAAGSEAVGFAMSMSATPRKRDKLADRLTWLINRDKLGLEEERGEARYQASGEATINLSDGSQLLCSVTDISLTGAAFETAGRPPFVGERVTVGNLVGEVVRVTGKKFGVRYVHGQKPAD